MPLLKTGLDNPIWSALISHQDYLAEGNALARRFPVDIGPLVGIADQSEAAYADLRALTNPDEQLVLFLDEPPAPSAGWHLDVQGHLTQMVLETGLLAVPEMNIELLG